MRTICLALVLLSALVCGNSLRAQPEPSVSDPSEPNSQATFSKDGVWHKNIEFISPSKTGPSSAGEHFQAISIGNKHYVVMPANNVGSIPDALELYDVTDPRDIELALRISGFTKRYTEEAEVDNRTLITYPLTFGSGDVWKDNSSGQALSGHVFAIFHCTGGSVPLTVERNSTDKLNTSARFIVFDLTESLSHTTTTNKHIIIDDAASRNSAHLEGETDPSDFTHEVYLGFTTIPANDFAN